MWIPEFYSVFPGPILIVLKMAEVQNIVKIKILELIGTSIILANRAAGIINYVRTMDMHIVDKSFDECHCKIDPTTIAGIYINYYNYYTYIISISI